MVTRYNHYITYDDIPHMEEHTNGEYVKWVDYQKLAQAFHKHTTVFQKRLSASEELEIFKRAAKARLKQVKSHADVEYGKDDDRGDGFGTF